MFSLFFMQPKNIRASKMVAVVNLYIDLPFQDHLLQELDDQT